MTIPITKSIDAETKNIKKKFYGYKVPAYFSNSGSDLAKYSHPRPLINKANQNNVVSGLINL